MAVEDFLGNKLHGTPDVSKGSLIVGRGEGVFGDLLVGTDTQVLTADHTKQFGVKWAAAGSSSTFPDFTGSGSPEGVKTAAVGKSYYDTAGGALYTKNTGSGNTGWLLGSALTVPPIIPGVGYISGEMLVIGNIATIISDVAAVGGTGNSATWDATGGDGNQQFGLTLGAGNKLTLFKSDGSTHLPGQVVMPHGSWWSITDGTDTHGADGDWGLGADAHIYFHAGGVWVLKV